MKNKAALPAMVVVCLLSMYIGYENGVKEAKEDIYDISNKMFTRCYEHSSKYLTKEYIDSGYFISGQLAAYDSICLIIHPRK